MVNLPRDKGTVDLLGGDLVNVRLLKREWASNFLSVTRN